MSVSSLVWIMMAAVAARAWLLFSTQFVPGVNGAYYLVQARTVIERGTLGIPDMPLTFYLHAALAWSLANVSGMAQADAIMMAVKACDAVLPTLVAWPVFVLVRRWAKARGSSHAVPLAAATLACLAFPWLMVVGELQKNSLALVWLALVAMTLHGWLLVPTRRRGIAPLAALIPLGLTHIGVLGAGLVLAAASLLVFALCQGRRLRWRLVLPWLGAGVAIILFTAALVFWNFDPSRIHRLITALTDPSRFSSDGKQPPGHPANAMGLDRWLPFLAFALVVVPSVIIAWRRRKGLAEADLAPVAGGTLTVLAMTGPWFGMDKAIRFYLIALLPAIIVGSFSMLYIVRPGLRRAVLGLVLLIGLSGTVMILLPGGKPVLEKATMEELKSLARYIQRPDRTLVVAEHGVEWWSAWFLHTKIAQAEALRPEDWQSYETILFLEVKSGLVSLPGRGGPSPGTGQGPGPDDSRPRRLGKEMHPKRPMLTPANAEIVHDGATLRLTRIVTVPNFVVAGDLSSLTR